MRPAEISHSTLRATWEGILSLSPPTLTKKRQVSTEEICFIAANRPRPVRSKNRLGTKKTVSHAGSITLPRSGLQENYQGRVTPLLSDEIPELIDGPILLPESSGSSGQTLPDLLPLAAVESSRIGVGMYPRIKKAATRIAN